MKEDSLYTFDTPQEFFNFYDELNIYGEWKIQKGLLNKRGSLIQNKPYVNLLRDKFFKRGFFRKQVSIAEIVSWLDTMFIIKRYLTMLQASIESSMYSQIKIYVEYMIKMSKKMRVDYIFKYNNTILLVEFRTVSTFEKIRPTWDLKFRELLIYKELMRYYIKHKSIILYAFITMFEYDNKRLVEKNHQYNENQIKYLVEYTIKYLIQKNEFL